MFHLKIETTNDAFTFDGGGCEVARILRELADEIETTCERRDIIFDLNGNRVGEWKFSNAKHND